jgi:hypothetical protein
MELIDIIFTILKLSAVTLLIVILVSFLLSRRNRNVKERNSIIVNSKPSYYKFSYQNNEQSLFRKENHNPQPFIFHVDQVKNKDLRIVRKQTHSDREQQDSIRSRYFRGSGNSSKNFSRYTIVNEEMDKNRKPFVVNFYQ